jgi:hypothetical protein
VQGAVLALVVGPCHDQRVAFLPDHDRLGRAVLEGAVRALHDHLASGERDLDPGRDGDGLLADA